MPGILGTKASLIYDVNFILQTAIVILILVGYLFMREKKLVRHGTIMTSAVIVHAILIIFVMGPSFIIYFGLLVSPPFNLGILVTWIHAILGIISTVLGIFIVTKWNLRKPSALTCIQRKKWMKPTMITWVSALILGLSFYVLYYL